jgi:hypothetical protein
MVWVLSFHFHHSLNISLIMSAQSAGSSHTFLMVWRLSSHFPHCLGSPYALCLHSLTTYLAMWGLHSEFPHILRASFIVLWHPGGIPHCLGAPLALCPHNSLALWGLSSYHFPNTFLTFGGFPLFPCPLKDLPHSLRTYLWSGCDQRLWSGCEKAVRRLWEGCDEILWSEILIRH